MTTSGLPYHPGQQLLLPGALQDRPDTMVEQRRVAMRIHEHGGEPERAFFWVTSSARYRAAGPAFTTLSPPLTPSSTVIADETRLATSETFDGTMSVLLVFASLENAST